MAKHSTSNMLTVTIPVHPLSRAVMLSEYGGEPVTLDNHDILFEIVNTRITPDDLRKKTTALTHFLELHVNNRLAAHLARFGHVAGARLFKFHKHLLCRYADAQVRAKGKGHARPAIQQFLNLYGIEEDAYGLDTAYKLFQRFGWEIRKKNPCFFGQNRRNTGAILPNKTEGSEPDISLPAEVVLTRFMAAVRFRMKRYHRRLEKQARTYIYMQVCGITEREAAEKLGLPKSTAHYCAAAMRRRIGQNPTYARLIEEALALPEPAI